MPIRGCERRRTSAKCMIIRRRLSTGNVILNVVAHRSAGVLSLPGRNRCVIPARFIYSVATYVIMRIMLARGKRSTSIAVSRIDLGSEIGHVRASPSNIHRHVNPGARLTGSVISDTVLLLRLLFRIPSPFFARFSSPPSLVLVSFSDRRVERRSDRYNELVRVQR